MSYLFDHAWTTERDRLTALEAVLDPFTRYCLNQIGIKEGWRCVEVGAGGGSIAEHLSRAVGNEGRVVATDLETGFLETIKAPNIEVRRHDITMDELEPNSFDLVHARCVLEHLKEPLAASQKMIDALRPGGWIMVEDSYTLPLKHITTKKPELFEKVFSVLQIGSAKAGVDLTFGIHLGDTLRTAGLEDVQVRGGMSEWGGSNAATVVWKITFERVRERLVASGLISAEEYDEFLAEIQGPDFHAITAAHMAAWGRKPALSISSGSMRASSSSI